MENVRDTTARLRRTFRYPGDDDDDDDSLPDAMDEQEQERLIDRLTADNAARDAQFRLFLLAVPLIATLPYLPSLLRPKSALFSLLGLTSLLSTAYLLHILPPSVTGIAILDAWVRQHSGSKEKDGRRHGGGRGQLQAGIQQGLSKSPLETYLPYLNVGLAALLVLMGAVGGLGRDGSLGWIGLGNLPALVLAIVLLAKTIMAGVDPSSELSALRYEYKGA